MLAAASFGRAALTFGAKHWKLILVGAGVALLAIMLLIRTHQRDDARHQRDTARAETRAAIAEMHAFADRVRAATAQVQRTYAANALRVEREQNQISQEVSDAYQTRIADLNGRAAALRLRAGGAATADPGGAGAGRNAGLPDAAGGAHATAAQNGLPAGGGLALEDAIVATEQAIQLDELQGWLRRQQAIVRTPPPEAAAPAR